MQPINVNSQNAIPFIFISTSTISLVVAILTLLPDGILCPTVSWTALGVSSACLIMAVLLSHRSKKLIVPLPNEIISSQTNLSIKATPFASLPADITLQMCSFLSFSDLSSLRCVNKLFTQDRFCIPLAKALGFADTSNVTQAQNNIRFFFNSYIPPLVKMINRPYYQPHRKHQDIVQEVLSWQTRSSKELISSLRPYADLGDLCRIIPFLLKGRKPDPSPDKETLEIADQLLDGMIEGNEKNLLNLVSLLAGCGINFTSLPSHHRFLKDAALTRKLEACKVFLSLGAPINYCSTIGTALHCAVLVQDPKIVEFLLMNGANPNIVSPDKGYTPLMRAVEKGNKELVKILLKAQSDVNVRGLYDGEYLTGETAFSLSRDYPEIRQMLIDAGVPPTTDMNGN